MTNPAPLRIAIALALSLALPAAADEITDQIDAARAQYESGDLRQALQGLQLTVAGIQEKINLALLKLLPEPKQGWRADEPQAQTAGMLGLISGTNLSRRYFRNDGAEVEISVMADSPLIPMLTMTLSNPMLMQTSPSSRVYTYAGQRGTIEHESDSDSWAISLLIDNKILLKLDGNGLPDKEILEAYLQDVDLEAIRKAFAS